MNLESEAWGATRRGPNASNSVRLVNSFVSVTSTQIWTLHPSCSSCSIVLPFPPCIPVPPPSSIADHLPPPFALPSFGWPPSISHCLARTVMSSAQLLPNVCIFLLCVEVQPPPPSPLFFFSPLPLPPPFSLCCCYPLSLSLTVVLVRMCRARHSQRR